MTNTTYTLGIDSTTVKIAILDDDHKILFSDYERHYANIQETLASLLEKAEQLLKETNKSITEIAQLTGFSDVFYFSKIFHRKKGCPPGEYRKTYIPGI